ncbi:MAG TPA: hypothetical protein VNX18_12865 [Bryobacteraceae bacterium]|nr:hypothetical protein [Bryobacteraceae bacterium]
MEAGRVKALNSRDPETGETGRALDVLHIRLRDWIESRLRTVETPQPGPLKSLEASLDAELNEARLALPEHPPDINDGPGGSGMGYAGVKFKWLPEFPDALFVIASASMDCGSDEAVYMYLFRAGHWQRTFTDHPGKDFGYTGVTLKVSEPDAQSRRLLLVHYYSVQCASTWMGMSYSIFRVNARGDTRQLLSDRHGFWLGNDGPEFVVSPHEVIVEFLDSSVDVEIHNRTHIHRYNFAQGTRRLEPIALQPQDFVEEWLTRPWDEVKSWSAAGLKELHGQLHSDYIGARYLGVVPCGAKAGNWLVELSVTRVGEREFSDPLETYFLVRDLGNYRYRMEAVPFETPPECEGTGLVSDGVPASNKHPWLSTDQLGSLLGH